MRIRLVEESASRVPPLGGCPSGHGALRTVTKDGETEFFECGLKSGGFEPGRKRFHPPAGLEGQVLWASDRDSTPDDFGRIEVDQGVRYFEWHLPERS